MYQAKNKAQRKKQCAPNAHRTQNPTYCSFLSDRTRHVNHVNNTHIALPASIWPLITWTARLAALGSR